MVTSRRANCASQAGVGLVEIMIALAIGLVTTLVIMQLVTTFEGQKRSTTGTADAQTNGSIALYMIQRQAQLAGYGLPIYSAQNPALNCDPLPQIDHDGDAATEAIDTFPVFITDGGGGVSDTIRLRSSSTMMGGIPLTISNIVGNTVSVVNNFGCQVNDIAFAANGAVCRLARVTAVAANTQVTLDSVAGMAIGSSFACLGSWSQNKYDIANGSLRENDSPAVAGIVSIQAQYGVANTPTDRQVTAWVDATAGSAWEKTALITPAVNDRNRIKAIRVAIVARNGSMEKENVTNPCSSLTGAAPTGLCAWEGTAASPAPAIDLSADPNWRRYRYRVFETIIPLRNMIWTS